MAEPMPDWTVTGDGCNLGENLRMLIDELGGIVNDIVDHKVEILLGVVLGNVLVGELLSRGHCVGCVVGDKRTKFVIWPVSLLVKNLDCAIAPLGK
jgi:hypothetical protein